MWGSLVRPRACELLTGSIRIGRYKSVQMAEGNVTLLIRGHNIIVMDYESMNLYEMLSMPSNTHRLWSCLFFYFWLVNINVYIFALVFIPFALCAPGTFVVRVPFNLKYGKQ